jgi:predicted kinase
LTGWVTDLEPHKKTSVPILYIFAGLPGSGKSTLAQALARRLAAVYVRIDTIEQQLKDSGHAKVTTEGYEVAYQIAADNLKLGLNVVADSCNTVIVTRRAWRKVAMDCGAQPVDIEIVCSDKAEHRRRIETRASIMPRLTWQEVENREYHPWSGDRMVVDTAGRSESESFDDLCRTLSLR